MKNPKAPQPDPISNTVPHEGINKPMNDNLGTSTDSVSSRATDVLGGDTPSTDNYDSATQALDELVSIDPNHLINETAIGQDSVQEGLTPIHHQNIDESRIDEVLVEDNLDDDDYPTIRDIADDEAVDRSYDDE